MQTLTIFYICISGIIALLLALFQYGVNSKIKGKRRWILSILRALTYFFLFMLLINPKFEKVSYYNEKPNLVIAVDNSESIAYLKQSQSTIDFVKALKSDKSLNAHFNLAFYSFGKTVQLSDSLSFDEKQTNMARLFKDLSEVYDNSIAPTLIISDGNQTYGNDYTYMLNRYKQAIFTVVLGDTITYTDLKIEQLNVNRYAYLKNKFPVEIIATYTGSDKIKSQLKVTLGSSTLFSKALIFSKSQTSQIINFALPASKVGVTSYKVELVPLEQEKNKINNFKRFAVEVIDEKTNVAIVSNSVHPDLGALKKSIESNEQRKASILSTTEFLKNTTDYQLAIVYQPDNDVKELFENTERLKINTFVIIGTKTNLNELNKYQSNYTHDITNQTEAYQPSLNPNYGSFIVDNLNFNDFPPLQGVFGKLNLKLAYDTILYKSVNGNEIEDPLLATFEINDRRGAVLLGEGLWRWRAQAYLDDNSFNTFDSFIGKLIQYLSNNKRKTRLEVSYESFYNGSENTKISAQFFNKNYEFDTNASLSITLKNKVTEAIKKLPFVLKNTTYEVDISTLEAEDYSFTVKANKENISQSGEFKILNYNIEQQFLNANVNKLKVLADKNNGATYFIDDTSTLSNNLINDSRFATIQKSTKKVVPLVDRKYLLMCIILTLAAEWFIRKYNGLI